MTAAIAQEQEDKLRLRKSGEFLRYCGEVENRARGALVDAEQTRKAAKDKHEALFALCENRAVARRKAGLIEFVAGY